MKIFADCADLDVMEALADQVTGFTTNPTIMRAAGVTNYEHFAKRAVATFPHHSISLEVIADTLVAMSEQAHKLASWGNNVYCKIPVTTTDGVSTVDLVNSLSRGGVHVNVTAMFTMQQFYAFNNAVDGGADAYLSIFAGRIADTGRDPATLIRYAALWSRPNVSLLWASAREVLNVKQAADAGADIITLAPDLLAKYAHYGKSLDEFSLETVSQFLSDAQAAGLTL